MYLFVHKNSKHTTAKSMVFFHLIVPCLQKCTSEQVSQFSARNDTFEDDWEDWDKPDSAPASPEGKSGYK